MGTETLTYDQVASLSDLSEESFRPFFETILRKGLVWTQYREDGEELYYMPGIMLGWFEMVLSDGKETPEKKEFARRVDRLFQSWKKMNFFPLRNLLNYKFKRDSKALRRIVLTKRPSEIRETIQIDVQKKLKTPETKIYPFQSVYELIEKYGDKNKIAVVHCFCRQWRKLVGESCRFDLPAESCIVIGDASKYVVDYGIGRYISKEKALEIIEEVQEKGAIHQVFHEREDINRTEIAICNCCWDCCGVLGSYNRGIIPLHFKSYYSAQISDSSLCTGCGTCIKYCPVQAISLKDNKSQIDVEKCIGCGQCELKCPEGVITLEFKKRDVILPLQKKSEVRIHS
jgi:ferredoxin